MNDGSITRINLLGSGMGNTKLVCAGNGITYAGSVSSGVNAYCHFEGFRLVGTGNAGNGLTIQDASAITTQGILIQEFNVGILMYDVLQSHFSDLNLGANNCGLIAQMSNFSPPNAILFTNVQIDSNNNFGVLLGDPTTCTFQGGAIQGNGVTGSASDRYGVAVICNRNQPLDGAVGANFVGTYFEGNGGAADIWLQAGNGSDGNTSANIIGCIFNRISGTPGQFVPSNIRCDVGAPNKLALNLIGNGFQGFNSYQPSASTPYVALNLSAGAKFDVTDWGTNWGSDLERPSWPLQAKCPQSTLSAAAAIDGATSSIYPGSFNIAKLTKNGVGDYTLTFSSPMPFANYPISLNMNGQGYAVPFFMTTESVRFQTFNFGSSPVLTDFTYISLMVGAASQLF
jgi:hypothetical protein